MRDLLRTIEQALQARGWSARQASLQAVGTSDLITNMRRGRVPSVARLQALCDVLDLEFYVGPPRAALPVDERRLALALEAAEHGLAAAGRALDAPDRARLVAAVYQLIGDEGAPAAAARVQGLVEMVAGAGPGAAGRREGQ